MAPPEPKEPADSFAEFTRKLIIEADEAISRSAEEADAAKAELVEASQERSVKQEQLKAAKVAVSEANNKVQELATAARTADATASTDTKKADLLWQKMQEATVNLEGPKQQLEAGKKQRELDLAASKAAQDDAKASVQVLAGEEKQAIESAADAAKSVKSEENKLAKARDAITAAEKKVSSTAAEASDVKSRARAAAEDKGRLSVVLEHRKEEVTKRMAESKEAEKTGLDKDKAEHEVAVANQAADQAKAELDIAIAKQEKLEAKETNAAAAAAAAEQERANAVLVQESLSHQVERLKLSQTAADQQQASKSDALKNAKKKAEAMAKDMKGGKNTHSADFNIKKATEAIAIQEKLVAKIKDEREKSAKTAEISRNASALAQAEVGIWSAEATKAVQRQEAAAMAVDMADIVVARAEKTYGEARARAEAEAERSTARKGRAQNLTQAVRMTQTPPAAPAPLHFDDREAAEEQPAEAAEEQPAQAEEDLPAQALQHEGGENELLEEAVEKQPAQAMV